MGRTHPRDEWNVRQLINHVVVEQVVGPAAALTARSIRRWDHSMATNSVRPEGSWDEAVALSRAAFSQPEMSGTVHLSYGDESVARITATR